MSSKELSMNFLRCLYRLFQGEELKASEISSKSLLKKFLDDGLIKERMLSKHRRIYHCANPQGLSNYLEAQYDLLSLESYIHQKESSESDGAQSLEATKSTKVFRERSLQGFFIKAFGASLFIDQEEIPVVPDGIELFIHQPEKLKLSPSTLVVGVENPECFVKFKQLRKLFPHRELLVIMRYMSKSPNKWLKTIPNHYIHFGDFDPAGISIYIHEYRNRLGSDRCAFFIPDNIENMLQQFGATSLYDKQYHQIKNVVPENYPEIQSLIVLMNKYKKGLEQERLLAIEV